MQKLCRVVCMATYGDVWRCMVATHNTFAGGEEICLRRRLVVEAPVGDSGCTKGQANFYAGVSKYTHGGDTLGPGLT